MQDHASVEFGYSTREESTEQGVENSNLLADCFGHDERFGGRLKPFAEYLTSVVERGEQVVIVSRQSPRLHELWLEHQDAVEGLPVEIEFIESSLSEGFVVDKLHLISD